MTEELEELRRRKMEELFRSKNNTRVNPVSVVIEKAMELADAILNCPEYLTFNKAQKQMSYDPEAQSLMQEFQQKQQSLMWLQQIGGKIGIDEVQELKDLQAKMLHHPTISAYFQSQQQLTQLVQTVNDTISKKTGLNFASTGGCC